jgi:tetratricopeptide (TPR) repeat protein
VSYTELEFMEAGAAGLPRLVFLLDEAVPSLSVGPWDTDRGPVNRFRQRVRNAALITRAFTSNAGLELEVFHALCQVDGRGQDVIPRQLPAAVPHFTGRTSDLALLNRLADSCDTGGTVVISAIGGTAGVGKTALAVHWGHQVRDRFPDGDLYVNLRGYAPEPPLTASQALDVFLRALNVLPELIPQNLEARAALFRTMLTRRRLLIVLDNASSADQVRPLLPGSPGCLVLVTSRSQLSGLAARDGAHRMTLDTLPPHEALTLMRLILGDQRVDNDRRAAAKLASRCGYLPLALRIAAEHIAERPQALLADLSADLAGDSRLDTLMTADGDEMTSVRKVFSWSYRGLPAQAARAFRLLGLSPGPDISIPAAAALLGISTAEARSLLNRLLSVHLLELVGSGRYRFHDLLRDYAVDCAHADESDQSQRRAVHQELTWYMDASGAAFELFFTGGTETKGSTQPGNPDLPFSTYEGALQWCEAELANLLAATRRAATIGEDTIAWKIPHFLGEFLQLSMRYTESTATHEIALAAARREDNPSGEAAILAGLGISSYYLNQFVESFTYTQQALTIYREIGETGGEAMTLVNLGGVHTELGQFSEAINCLHQALGIAQESGDRLAEGHALENLAEAHRKLQRNDEAIICLQAALDIFREIGRSFGEGNALAALAETYLALQNYAEADRCCQQSMTVRKRNGDRLGEARLLDIYANVLQATGRAREARQAWDRALTILDEVGHPDGSKVRAHLTASGLPSFDVSP